MALPRSFLLLAVTLCCGIHAVAGHDLDCRFNEDLCYWTHPEGQGQRWLVEVSAEGGDGFLLFKPTWESSEDDGSDGVTTLQSPLVEAPPSATIHFTYWLVVNGEGSLRVRIQYYSASAAVTGEQVVFERRRSSGGNQIAEVSIVPTDGYLRVLIDATEGEGFYGLIHLSGFRFEVGCEESWCQNGGTCIKADDGESVECRCPPGFGGKECESYVSRDAMCSGVDVMVSAYPESFMQYITNSFGIKCLVYTDLQSANETAVCDNGERSGLVSSFRAVTSLFIRKENEDTCDVVPVAMVSTYDTAKSLLGEGIAAARGQVTLAEEELTSELAFLNVDWTDPDESVAGVYVCQVTGLDTLGQRVGAEVRAEVVLQPATLESLKDKIDELEQEIDRLEAEVSACAKP